MKHLAQLRRWEAAGGTWRVQRQGDAGVTVALLTCGAGEQVDEIASAEPALLAYVANAERSGDEDSTTVQPDDGR